MKTDEAFKANPQTPTTRQTSVLTKLASSNTDDVGWVRVGDVNAVDIKSDFIRPVHRGFSLRKDAAKALSDLSW